MRNAREVQAAGMTLLSSGGAGWGREWLHEEV